MVTYLDETSTANVSVVVADQLEALFTRRGLVEWQLGRNLPLSGDQHVGTEASMLRSIVVEAICSQSVLSFGCWRLKATVGHAREEWVFSVADELLPHLHCQLDRLNSSIVDDREGSIACREVVQRGLGDFCWDAKTFGGDRVSIYAYFKIQALQKRLPSLSVQPPGWEHPCFVARLRRTLRSLSGEDAGSVRGATWTEILGTMKAIDALFSADPNSRILEDLLGSLGWRLEDWLAAY